MKMLAHAADCRYFGAIEVSLESTFSTAVLEPASLGRKGPQRSPIRLRHDNHFHDLVFLRSGEGL
jgi:hypothetical protein